jgi:hypothetical protein
MPPSGKCRRRVALAATMVDDFELNKKNTNKTQLLPSFLTVNWRKKGKQFQDPSRTLYPHPWRGYL